MVRKGVGKPVFFAAKFLSFFEKMLLYFSEKFVIIKNKYKAKEAVYAFFR